MESGTVFTLQSFPVSYGGVESAESQAGLFLAALRLKSGPEGLSELRGCDPAVISSLGYFNPDWTIVAPFSFGPSQDGAIIPLSPQAAMSEGSLNKVKILIGFNTDESTLFTLNLKDAPTARAMVASYLGPGFLKSLWEAHKPSGDQAEMELAKKAITLGMFSAGAKRVADLHSRHADVFMYRFGRVSKDPQFESLGAFHASELPYVFGGSGLASPEDKRLGEDIRIRWANFIKTGDPNKGAKPPSDLSWPRYDPASPLVMRFDGPVSVGLPPELGMLDEAAAILYGDLPER